MAALPKIDASRGRQQRGAKSGGLPHLDATGGPGVPGEKVAQWTPHDVAEWLYGQGTREDYAHTFLVHGIDGSALLNLTRDQLADWKVKATDISTILKGVQVAALPTLARAPRCPRASLPPHG